MADIGTDHGLLPVFLVESGRVPWAIGIDDKPEPLANAAALAARSRAALELRLGSGCAPLRPGEVHTLTIAGMGGPLITRILGAEAAGASRLVLQPNAGEARLRAWLARQGWSIDAEQVVPDRSRLFTVMAAGRSTGPRVDPDPPELAYGSVAVHRDLPALARRLAEDDARVTTLLGACTTEVGREALRGKLAVIAIVRGRLGDEQARRSRSPA